MSCPTNKSILYSYTAPLASGSYAAKPVCGGCPVSFKTPVKSVPVKQPYSISCSGCNHREHFYGFYGTLNN
jgi:hypothetical protein